MFFSLPQLKHKDDELQEREEELQEKEEQLNEAAAKQATAVDPEDHEALEKKYKKDTQRLENEIKDLEDEKSGLNKKVKMLYIPVMLSLLLKCYRSIRFMFMNWQHSPVILQEETKCPWKVLYYVLLIVLEVKGSL